MTAPSKAYEDREPLSNEEIDGMLVKADEIEDEYFRLRVKAIISIAKKFGKRRSEIASLQRLSNPCWSASGLAQYRKTSEKRGKVSFAVFCV